MYIIAIFMTPVYLFELKFGSKQSMCQGVAI